MNIVFFTHPTSLGSLSTQRYAKWLADGMHQRGHHVKLWIPRSDYFDLPVPKGLKKWMSYIDQYVTFPSWVKKQIKKQPADTLYVFTDHAQGPWVPLVKDHLHVLHCHDFLAQRSALGEIPENPISWTGRQYQSYIRRGFQNSKNFISISEKTRQDLHTLLARTPAISEVVYNGISRAYKPSGDVDFIIEFLQETTGIDLSRGYILHVGANQWNKNRKGVIEIYDKWRENFGKNLPLLMVGPDPDQVLNETFLKSKYQKDIHFLLDKPDEFVGLVYQAASVFLFPSMDEGFGWPIAESMASGTPVITTKAVPMTEVAGNAALLINRRPFEDKEVEGWALDAAKTLETMLNMDQEQRKQLIDKGLENVQRFDSEKTIASIETIYEAILHKEKQPIAVQF